MVSLGSRWALGVCLLLVVGCGPPPQPELPPDVAAIGGVGPRVYALAQPGVVRVDAGLRTGTGVVVGPGEVLTAAHVVRDAFRVEIVAAPGAEARVATLVGVDEPLDLALLRVEGLSAAPLALASEAPGPGLEVWTLGHPNGRDWSIARGVISHVDATDGAFLSSLAAEPGSSGGPVLTYRADKADGTDERVAVVGLVSQVLPAEGQGQTAVVPTSVISSALGRLREGTRVGWADPVAFVQTLHNRSPLVHQVLMAQRIEVDGPGEDIIAGVTDTLVFDAFPATETLELRTEWRYFFAGSHTFAYKVARVDADGGFTVVHEGPLRSFELDGDRKSYVHKVEIDLDFDGPGDYAVLVETHERLSAVFPFQVVERGQSAPPGSPPDWRAASAPLQHAVVVASRVTGSELDTDTSGRPAPSGDLTVQATFNTIRLPGASGERTVRFDTLSTWSGGFAGAHTFEHVLVDVAGREIARGKAGEFTLSDSRASHEHVAQWAVEFPAAGLYFVLCSTDGRITRAIPIWVQDA